MFIKQFHVRVPKSPISFQHLKTLIQSILLIYTNIFLNRAMKIFKAFYLN